ncbi:hypothetical protein Moror_5854 [Moniliophthora roreri MCA 2997]|uniref:Uncharacterized protein n=1 Tax=Moniliophthora roreri (strain MCA 2997) TaxID=1381753 RepID=V2WK38_MONRO|nr:hypothetical protein Moror_5854 [Moniliophthora roreri MCA 2997]
MTAWLNIATQLFSENDSVLGKVLPKILEVFNYNNFVSIQFHAQPGSELGDLGYFYNESLKVLSPNPKKRHPATLVPKEPFMFWEVSFDVDRFQSFHRIEDSEMPSFSLPQTSGPKRKSAPLSGVIPISKRVKSVLVSKPAPLISSFVP